VKEVKNTTIIVVNGTTCFGLFGGHHQVLRLLAIGG